MIEYLGYKTNSMYEGEVIREEVDTVRNTYYSEDKSKALLQLDGIFNRGLVGIGEIHKYYFERIANDGKRYNCKYSINELLASDELVQMFINSTKKNKKLFNSDLLGNFNKKLSLGAGGVCGINLTDLRPSGDPIKGVDGLTSGVVPVMKLFEDSFSYSDQMG